MSHLKRIAALTGAAAGLTNGFFGGGGGAILVPAFARRCGLSQRRAFATSLAVMLPLSALSCVIYLFRAVPEPADALPYLLGGAAGGWIGGKKFQKADMVWLRRVFALLMLFGGVKALLL